MDFDELPNEDDGGQGGGDAAPVSFDSMRSEVPSFDDMQAERELSSTAWGAGLRRGLMEVPVGAVAGVAGIAGAVPGAAAGALTSPVTGPVGPVVGGLATGIPAAMAAGAGASALEDWLLDKMGLREGSGFFSREQEMADKALHPNTSFVGELAGQVLPSFGTGIGRGVGMQLGNRAVGGGIQGGIEAGQELYNEGSLDPFKVGANVVAGAAAPNARSWAQSTADAVTNPVANAFQRWKSGGVTPGPNPQPPSPPTGASPSQPTPGPQPQGPAPGGAGPASVIDPVTQAKQAHADQLAVVEEKLATMAPDDPMRPFWESHEESLKKGAVEGDPANEFDASQGPDGTVNAMTPADAAKANQQPTVSRGTSLVQSPPPRDVGQGNPAGASMSERVAAKPADETRDYTKATPRWQLTAQAEKAALAAGDTATVTKFHELQDAGDYDGAAALAKKYLGIADQPAVKMSTAPVHEDVMAALTVDAPPKPPAAAPEAPVPTGLPQATQQAITAGNKRGLAGVRTRQGLAKRAAAEAPPNRLNDVLPGDAKAQAEFEGRPAEPHIPDVPRPADQMLHPIEQTAQAVNRVMEPMEASALTRDAQGRAMEAVRARNEAQQVAEEPPAPSINPDRPAVAQQKPLEGEILAPERPSKSGDAAFDQKLEAAYKATEAHDPGSKEWDRATGLIDSLEETAHEMRAYGPPDAPTVHLTPGEQKAHKANLDFLQAHDPPVPKVLEKVLSLPPREQAEAAMRARYLLESRTGKAQGTEAQTIRQPEKRPETSTGKMARSKADQARKEGSLAAVKGAVAEFGRGGDKEVPIPTTAADKAVLIDRLQKMWDKAVEFNGGKDPIDPKKGGYKPNEKPADWQLVRAAKKVLDKPTPANIRDFRLMEKPLLEGGAEAAKDIQQSARVEGDIRKKPTINEAASESMISKAQEDTATDRVVHEEFDNSKGEESAVYTRQQNALRGWLNHLSDESYKSLKAAHPDMDKDLLATQDPHELMNNYMDDLAGIQRKQADKTEGTVTTKVTPVKTAADLPAEKPAQAAAPVKKFAKGSPEWEAIAARALAAKPRDNAGRLEAELGHSKEGLLDRGQKTGIEAFENKKDALAAHEAERQETKGTVVSGSTEDAAKTFLDMMKDESGAAHPGQMLRWMKNTIMDLWSPEALTPLRQYADDLSGKFLRLTNKLSQEKGMLRANALSAKAANMQPADRSIIYRAMEGGTTGLLAPERREYYQTYVKPIKLVYERLYDEYRDNAIKHNLPEAEDLPERKNNGNGYTDWVPRIQKGKQSWDRADDNDAILGKTGLSRKASTLEQRDWFTLQNQNGNRLSYIPGDGRITIMRGGRPTVVKTPTNFDPKDIGSTLNMRQGGNANVWTVDHATVDEISRHGGTNPRTGRPFLEFHDNPLLAYTQQVHGLRAALERQKLFIDITESQIFKDNTTKSHKKAEELGWEAPKDLPPFADTYMPKSWAWAMNDYASRGFTFNEPSVNRAWQAWGRFSGAMNKLFYIFGPAVHVFNEADKWIIGRGARWIDPTAYPPVVKTTAQAFKDVWTQGPIQREMREAGANPMYMHTLTQNFLPEIARLTGEDIMRNPSKWDPIARAFGVTSKQMFDKAYSLSTRGMWWVSDVLLTQRYLEEKARRGLSPEEAVKSAHDFIDSYVLPTTVGKTLGLKDTGAGRTLQKFLTDQGTSLFGPYHYGVFHSWATLVKGLVGKESSLENRARAAGQLAVALAMGTVFYTAISHGYQKLVGDPTSEFEPRGMTRLAHTALDIYKGDKNLDAVMRNVWTPSIPASVTMSTISNRDFAGRPIREQGASVAQSAGQTIDWAARSLISPYGTLANAGAKRDATPGSVARNFAESMVGIKTPSEAETKYREHQEQHNRQNMRTRERRPRGPIEDFGNWLNEKF